MFKNKIIKFTIIFLLLTGCSNSYKRSELSGNYKSITVDELNEKLEMKETFVLSISRTTCSHCIDFKKNVLESYISNHEINFYDILIDKISSVDSIYKIIKDHPYPSKFLTEDMDPEAIYTPAFYFIVDGEYKEMYLGAMDMDMFDGLIVKYKMDKAKN